MLPSGLQYKVGVFAVAVVTRPFGPVHTDVYILRVSCGLDCLLRPRFGPLTLQSAIGHSSPRKVFVKMLSTSRHVVRSGGGFKALAFRKHGTRRRNNKFPLGLRSHPHSILGRRLHGPGVMASAVGDKFLQTHSILPRRACGTDGQAAHAGACPSRLHHQLGFGCLSRLTRLSRLASPVLLRERALQRPRGSSLAGKRNLGSCPCPLLGPYIPRL